MGIVTRFASNPLITPADVKPSRPDLEVMCAFNAGATLLGGETLLLVRVAERPVPEKGYVSTAVLDPARPGHYRILRVRLDDPDLEFTDPRVFFLKGVPYLTSISHLRLARSRDGRRFTVDPTPTLMPEFAHEEYGIEDARITRLGERWWVNYSAISARGVLTCLASTRDFRRWRRLGVMFAPDNKDIAIFPEKVGGRYYCFHRPSMKQLGAPAMWLASSPNLRDWGRHQFVIGPRPGQWDSERVGCGPYPIRTPAGWLQFYHGSNHRTRYCSGAVLLDLEQPWRVLARDTVPILEPEAPCETQGFMPNVCFCNGLVERGDGTVDLYYGAADQTVCGASLHVADVLAMLGKA